MRELSLLCIIATMMVVAVIAGQISEENIKRLDTQADELDKLTAGIVNVQDHIKHREKAHHDATEASYAMWHRLDVKFGGHCKKGQFTCGTAPDCVDHALCCDGDKDCENGTDERDELCHPDLKVGDKWEGKFIYYTCTNEILTDVSFELTKFARKELLHGFVDVEGTVHWKDETKYDHHMSEQLPYHGIYTYGSRNIDFRVDYHGETYHEHLYYYAGESHVLNYDIFHASTGDECGKAIMVRHRDDHHDDHHDDHT